MYSNWSYSPETPNLGKIWRFLEPCDLEIWRMTLKNNRAPLLCCFQLCVWFHCHMWIQTGVKSPETTKLVVDLCDLDLWPLTLTFCMDITSDNGNNSWKFHDDTMMGTWWKRCDGQTDGRTDRRTDGQTDGLNQSYSCLVAAKKHTSNYRWCACHILPLLGGGWKYRKGGEDIVMIF